MKKPIGIVFNDIHLKQNNEQAIIDSVKHMIAYAVENGIKDIFLAGDLFDSRSYQRQSGLETFDKIIGLFYKAGLTLYVFPGNHDKTEYDNAYSFLHVYRYHPGVKFNATPKTYKIGGLNVTLIPFFSDEILVPMLEGAKGGDILISHFEMAGSTNLGRVSEKTSITRKMLKKWKKVYLGHYHNTHEITDDIIHLASFRQASFGEDPDKGFTVIYDDLSYELVKGLFKEYLKIRVEVDGLATKDLKKLIKQHANSEKIVRFEFFGEESELKAIDKGLFAKTGIDIKMKYTSNFDKNKLVMPKVTKEFGQDDVFKNFQEFCKEKDYNHEIGSRYLKEFLGLINWHYYIHPESDSIWRTDVNDDECLNDGLTQKLTKEEFEERIEEYELTVEECTIYGKLEGKETKGE